MDIFTHMLIGYMIAWLSSWTVTGYHEYNILICVLMTMIPDFDVILYAVPKSVRSRFRGIRHRGVSHTVVFMLICSLIVAVVFNRLVQTPLVAGYLLALLGGLSHIAADALTSYAFPYLAPFSWKERSLDLDGAVTWYMVPYSVVNILTMWGMRAYQFPLSQYKIYVVLVFLGILIHYVARAGVKLYTERVLFKGQGVKVNPTPKLLSFYVMRPVTSLGVKMIEYVHTVLPVSRKKGQMSYIEVSRLGPRGANIGEPKDVYEAVVATSAALDPKDYKDLSNVAATQLASKAGQWRIFWFDWNDWNPMKGTAGRLVTIDGGSQSMIEPATEKISW